MKAVHKALPNNSAPYFLLLFENAPGAICLSYDAIACAGDVYTVLLPVVIALSMHLVWNPWLISMLQLAASCAVRINRFFGEAANLHPASVVFMVLIVLPLS